MPITTFPDIVIERTAKKLFEYIENGEREHTTARWESSLMQEQWILDAKEILDYAFNIEEEIEESLPSNPTSTMLLNWEIATEAITEDEELIDF